jgi:hypothetical protein
LPCPPLPLAAPPPSPCPLLPPPRPLPPNPNRHRPTKRPPPPARRAAARWRPPGPGSAWGTGRVGYQVFVGPSFPGFWGCCRRACCRASFVRWPVWPTWPRPQNGPGPSPSKTMKPARGTWTKGRPKRGPAPQKPPFQKAPPHLLPLGLQLRHPGRGVGGVHGVSLQQPVEHAQRGLHVWGVVCVFWGVGAWGLRICGMRF